MIGLLSNDQIISKLCMKFRSTLCTILKNSALHVQIDFDPKITSKLSIQSNMVQSVGYIEH